METNINTVKGITVVGLDGKLDSKTVPAVQTSFSPLIQTHSRIVLDMTRVTYLSSAGLRLLVMMHREISEGGGKLVLAGLTERARDTMAITGFLPYFTTFETVEAALAALQ
jgi:anti-sigma B factor antagonist